MYSTYVLLFYYCYYYYYYHYYCCYYYSCIPKNIHTVYKLHMYAVWRQQLDRPSRARGPPGPPGHCPGPRRCRSSARSMRKWTGRTSTATGAAQFPPVSTSFQQFPPDLMWESSGSMETMESAIFLGGKWIDTSNLVSKAWHGTDFVLQTWGCQQQRMVRNDSHKVLDDVHLVNLEMAS